MRLVVALIAVVLLEALTATRVHTQSPDLTEVRKRAGAYVRRFVDQFSNVVTEEDYEQRFVNGKRKRHLKSDFLLVNYPGQQRLLMVFRDVREVDGRPVRDKDDRISRLFLDPFSNAIRRAQEIHRDGLRYNIENGRLMDPLAVLGYLQPEYQGNFQMSLGGTARNLGPDVRELNLTPNRVRGQTARPARAWVSETTGEVYMTELRVGFGARAEITTTTFVPDPVLKVRVPAELRDDVPRPTDDFIGIAKYSNVRRFEVRTESAVELPAPAPER